ILNSRRLKEFRLCEGIRSVHLPILLFVLDQGEQPSLLQYKPGPGECPRAATILLGLLCSPLTELRNLLRHNSNSNRRPHCGILYLDRVVWQGHWLPCKSIPQDLDRHHSERQEFSLVIWTLPSLPRCQREC